MNSRPYLSIVTYSRNDDYYQGEISKQMQMALNSLIDQVKRFKLRAELIIVDWSPPADRPLLKDALSLPDNLGPLTVRFIVVFPTIHKKYGYSKKVKIPVAARNVGIRRADGEFILSTNFDILFSNELIHFLSSEGLKRDCFYRANKCDVDRKVLQCDSQEELIDFCKRNILQVHKKSGVPPLPGWPALHTSGVDFIVLTKEYFHRLHGWPELNNFGIHCDALFCYMAYLAGLKEKILENPMEVYHIDHYSKWRNLAKSKNPIYSFLKDKIYQRLDCNSKERMLIKQVNHFLEGIYYNQFKLRFRRKSFSENKDFDVGYITWEYRKVLQEILKGKRSYVYNDDNWGLPNENFKEFIIHSKKQ